MAYKQKALSIIRKGFFIAENSDFRVICAVSSTGAATG